MGFSISETSLACHRLAYVRRTYIVCIGQNNPSSFGPDVPCFLSSGISFPAYISIRWQI